MTPFSIRKEKAKEVFLLIKRLEKHNEYEARKEGEVINKENKTIIRRKAGDDWF